MLAKASALAVSVCFLAPSAAVSDPVVIEGVPSIGWSTHRYSHYIAALHAALQTVGSPIGYEELMVFSGAAFKMGWCPGRYSHGSRTAVPEDAVIIAAEAAGAKAERITYAKEDDAWQPVCSSIDEGRPVIQSKISAANLICGYDAERRGIYVQLYEATDTEYSVVPFRVFAGPSEEGPEVIFVTYEAGAPAPEPDWPEILARAIRFAEWPPTRRVHRYYVCGLAAYDAWAQTLRRGVDPEGVDISAGLTNTMSRVIADARAAASVVLAENAAIHDAFADAASAYMAEAETFHGMQDVLSRGHGGPWAEVVKAINDNFPDQDVREAAAQLIERAKEQEVVALDALREALSDLAPQTETTAPVAPQTAPAESARKHYQEGVRLKGARKYAEAATELRAAIKIDADHVDAHRVLAWVLIELKDSDSAAAEFRKVVELAPGSEKAAEAQRALQRLAR